MDNTKKREKVKKRSYKSGIQSVQRGREKNGVKGRVKSKRGARKKNKAEKYQEKRKKY